MRILFASAHPYLPEVRGGSQVNTHEMAQALVARGHQVAVLAGLAGIGVAGIRDRVQLKITGRRTCVRRYASYDVYRGWWPWEGAAECAAAFRPDVAVVQSGAILRVAGALRAAGVPILIYNHNVEFDEHGADMDGFLHERFVANSAYTAECYRQAYGIDSDVIVPLFDRSRYAVESRREDVLFINPHPQKGVDVALGLARAFPGVPFRFVRGWPLDREDESALRSAVAGLPNVRLAGETDRMREHYAYARVLLAPSRWAETWGRVATEAQFSGIPVLATRIGGLPEAVGPGGTLVEAGAGPEAWEAALSRLWHDPEHYRALSNAAATHANRAQIDPSQQLDHLERLLGDVVAHRTVRG